MNYFAYGSNLSQKRLEERVGKVKCLGSYALQDYQMLFNKDGSDGSAKANIVAKPGETAWGRVYQMSPQQKLILDGYEGLGESYRLDWFQVWDDCELKVFAYLALKTSEDCIPYHWYLYHVLRGAREAEFSKTVLDEIQSASFQLDPSSERSARELSIYSEKEQTLVQSGQFDFNLK